MRKDFLVNAIILTTFALFESTLIQINLVLVALVILCFLFDSNRLLFLAFLTGIVFDLLTRSQLGQNSFIYLVIVFLVLIYKDLVVGVEGQKSGVKNLPIFLIGLIIALLTGQILENVLKMENLLSFDFVRIVFETLISIILFPILWLVNIKFGDLKGLELEVKRGRKKRNLILGKFFLTRLQNIHIRLLRLIRI